MPSTSKSQKRLMGMAYAYKKGKLDTSDMPEGLVTKVKELADSMTMQELKDFAETKHDTLPDRMPFVNEFKYIKNFESFLNERFHPNQKSYKKDKGKSMEGVNIKKDLIYLSKKMKKFTEEEAIVQLLSKYKRKGYNTSLLMGFRNQHKDVARWIRDPEYIVDPQDYIDYKKKEVKPLKLSSKVKNHIVKNKK